jgi:hypothetical protein
VYSHLVVIFFVFHFSAYDRCKTNFAFSWALQFHLVVNFQKLWFSHKLGPSHVIDFENVMIAKHFQHTCTTEKEAKNQFYKQVERANVACLSHDLKLVMGDANAKVGRKTVHQPTIGKHSVHESTNENGLRLVDFAAGRRVAIKSGDQTSGTPQMYTPSTRSITA